MKISGRLSLLIAAAGILLTFYRAAEHPFPSRLNQQHSTHTDTSEIVIPIENLNPDRVNKNVWNKLTLPNRAETRYENVSENGRHALKAVSKNSASGFLYPVFIDPLKYPVIEWEWKINKVLEKGDLTSKAGDDYAARIYVNFEYDRKDLPLGERIRYAALKTFTSYEIPLRSINYVWANKAEKGTVTENAYTGWVNMIVAESGNDNAGKWVTARMNILESYRKAFGEEPRNIISVSLMTDSDNTGGEATAWYRNVIFSQTSAR